MRIHEVITFEGNELPLLRDVQAVLVLPDPPEAWVQACVDLGDYQYPVLWATEKRRRLVSRLGDGAPQFVRSEVRDILVLVTSSLAYVATNVADYKAYLAGQQVTATASTAEFGKANALPRQHHRPQVLLEDGDVRLSPEHTREIVSGLLQSLERHRENLVVVQRLLNMAYDNMHDVPDDEDEDGEEFGNRGVHDFVVRR